MPSFGQFAATSQFYLYGRKHCTRTGWEAARRKYAQPDLLEGASLDLHGKTFLITGANAGIGREISSFVASKGATVFMFCRNPSRAETARAAIVDATKNPNVHVILGDCGLEADVRRMWAEFASHSAARDDQGQLHLDALICNAGALLNERTLSSEGVEITFATHLLFGTYLLGWLALPTLRQSRGRLLAVSSGGMYNTRFPAWETATSTGLDKYDGQYAYAYAKRGQVLLMERWAQQHPEVKCVSCHPGWTQTEALDAAYGSQKSYLEPLRTPWQGAEGIAYLAVCPSAELESGAFYLDRQPQVKHMAGPFFSEGSFTKNSPAEVDEMMAKLDAWAQGRRPSAAEIARGIALKQKLGPLGRAIELERFMGEWHVLALIPSFLEVGVFDSLESYTLRDGTIRIRNTYQTRSDGGAAEIVMRATVANAERTQWTVDPKVLGVHLPLGLTYLIVDVDEAFSYTLVAVPDRSYLWIMTRRRPSPFSQASVPVLKAYSLTPDAPYSPGTDQRSEWERRLLHDAVRRASELGFRTDAIVRACWTETPAT